MRMRKISISILPISVLPISVLSALLILTIANMANAVLAAEPLIQATFSTNPVVVNPGNDGYIQLTLKNSGTVTSRIKISRVSFDSDIIPSGDWVAELSPLGAGDSVTSLFKFSVSGKASLGLHSLTFYIDYSWDTSSKTINPNAIINVQSPSILELTSIEPSSVMPGEKTNMIFTITNKGASSITDVIFTWTSSGNTILPLGSGNRIVIAAIGANSHYNISTEVSVSPSATPGLYPLGTSIQYTDRSGTSQNISSTAGIEIGGGTDFDVQFQESSSTGVSLSVANIGVNPATSVAIRIPEQERFSTTGAASVFIGDLNPGEYTMATFQIVSRNITQRVQQGGTPQEAGNAAGNLLRVEISYTDTAGHRQTVQKEVSIRTVLDGAQISNFGQRNGGFGIWLYVGIGVIGVVAVVIFFKFVKGKKLNLANWAKLNLKKLNLTKKEG